MKPLVPIRTPLKQRFADFVRGPLAFLVWISAALFAGLMLLRRELEVEVVGLVQGGGHVVTAPCDQRLARLAVTLFQEVRTGDELASFDIADLEARLNTTLARVEVLRAEFTDARKASESDWAADQLARADDDWVERRRLAQADEELALEELELGVKLATDRIEASRLALGRARTERLAAEGVGAAEAFDEARLSHEAVLERIRQNEAYLAGVRAARTEARARRAEFELHATRGEILRDLPLEAFPARIRAEELVLAELEVERDRRVLRAPSPGRVQAIHASAGQVCVTGEPLLTLVTEAPLDVLAYLPEEHGRTLDTAELARVRLPRAPWTESDCWIVAVGPALELLPERLWSNPSMPEYGLPFLARGPLSPELRAGERVLVKLRARGAP